MPEILVISVLDMVVGRGANQERDEGVKQDT